jgi:hypothetical protein
MWGAARNRVSEKCSLQRSRRKTPCPAVSVNEVRVSPWPPSAVSIASKGFVEMSVSKPDQSGNNLKSTGGPAPVIPLIGAVALLILTVIVGELIFAELIPEPDVFWPLISLIQPLVGSAGLFSLFILIDRRLSSRAQSEGRHLRRSKGLRFGKKLFVIGSSLVLANFLSGVYLDWFLYGFYLNWGSFIGFVTDNPVWVFLSAMGLVIALIGVQIMLSSFIADSAAAKGRSWSAFFWLSLLINPLVVWIVAVSLSPLPGSELYATPNRDSQPPRPDDPSQQLRGLVALRDDGLLSEAEFQEKKKEILGRL